MPGMGATTENAGYCDGAEPNLDVILYFRPQFLLFLGEVRVFCNCESAGNPKGGVSQKRLQKYHPQAPTVNGQQTIIKKTKLFYIFLVLTVGR